MQNDDNQLDWDDIREQVIAKHDLAQTFESLFPGSRVLERGGKYLKYRCPWHGDRGPSLIIWRDQHMKCFGGCEINHSTKPANVIDLICHVFNVTAIKALELLGALPEYEHQPVQAQSGDERPKLTMQNVNRGFRNWKKAVEALRWRGISEESVLKWHLGYIPDYRTRITYRLADKSEVERLACPRISIPHITLDSVRYINLRLDMNAAYERIDYLRHDAAAQRIADDVKARLRAGDDFQEQLAFALFGDKYLFMYGSRALNAIFNGGDLVQIDENGVVDYPTLDVATVHEGELDAITTRQYLGVPSVATKGSAYLGMAMRSVKHLVIVKDADKPRLINGVLSSPGDLHAERSLHASGRTLGQGVSIAEPLPGYKDCNAMAQMGVLQSWWDGLGIHSHEALAI